MKTSILLCVCAVILLAAVPALSAEISGKITVYGCEPDASQLGLRARPLPGNQAAKDQKTNPGRGVLMARIQKLSGNSFSFSIPDAELGGRYALSVRLVPPACGKVFWRSPGNGLVFAGQSNIVVEGYAARTQVEIMSESTGGGRTQWVGAASMDVFDAASATRKMRIYTDLPDVKSVLLEVSTERFAAPGRLADLPCTASQPGVVGTLIVSVPKRGWNEVGPIDFKNIVIPTVPPTGDQPPIGLSPVTKRQLQAGAPLYVRAIPLVKGPDGSLSRKCNPIEIGVPGWVILSKLASSNVLQAENPLPPTKKFPHIYGANYWRPWFYNWPKQTDAYCYQVVKPYFLDPQATHDLCALWAIQNNQNPNQVCDKWGNIALHSRPVPDGSPLFFPGQLLMEGQKFCTPWSYYSTPASDDSFWEDLWEAIETTITALLDTVGALVMQIEALWEEIKGAVVKAMATLVQKLTGLNCGPETACYKVVGGALDTGLAAMGIPPSLPSWEQLKEQGIEYLAAQIADQAGVSPEVVSSAFDIAKDFIDRASEQRGGSAGGALPDWLVPDLGFEPAVLFVTFEQTGTEESGYDNWRMKMKGDEVYTSAEIPLPMNFPMSSQGRKLKVPIVLRGNLQGAQPAPPLQPYALAAWQKDHWGLDVMFNHLCTNQSLEILAWNWKFSEFKLFPDETKQMRFPVLPSAALSWGFGYFPPLAISPPCK